MHLEFVSSPLERARHTMDTLQCELGLSQNGYRLDNRLKEIQYGEWEGLNWSEVSQKYPKELEERNTDRWNFHPPIGGENYQMLYERVVAALRDLTRDSVIVSHGAVARALLVALCEAPQQKAPIEDILQGQVLVFRNGRALWG